MIFVSVAFGLLLLCASLSGEEFGAWFLFDFYQNSKLLHTMLPSVNKRSIRYGQSRGKNSFLRGSTKKINDLP